MTRRPPYSPTAGFSGRRLPNGLRVFLKSDPSWPLVSLQAWVRVGSVHEPSSQSGISHVLEHMVFKGTRRYRAVDMSRWIEAVGGSMNAETSQEYTRYFLDVPSAGAEKAVSILGALLQEADLSEAEWKRECPVILEEIKRRVDEPDVAVWELLYQAVFSDPAWQRTVIGTPESVSGLTAADLKTHYRIHYRPDNCVVVAVGDFSARAMRAWIGRALGGKPRGPRPPAAARPSAAEKPVELRVRKPVGRSYLAVGQVLRPNPAVRPEALDMLSTILGEGRNARLVKHLREDRKIVWSVGTSHLPHERAALFAVFLECDPSRRNQALRLLKRQLGDLVRRPPTEAEVDRAKNMMELAWSQTFETFHQQAAVFGHYAVENRLTDLRQYWERFHRLTAAGLRAAIRPIYETANYSTAMVEAGR